MRGMALALLAATVGLAGCGGEEGAGDLPVLSTPVVLGPADGRDLSPTDLERVRAGDVAPDFSLASLAGPVVTLSDYRGARNLVLVFYRGYW